MCVCVRLHVSIDCCGMYIEIFFFALKAVLFSVEILKAMICVIDGTSLQSILNSIGISYSVNITHDIYCFSNIKCSILLKSMPPFIGQDSNVSKKKNPKLPYSLFLWSQVSPLRPTLKCI